MHKISFSNERKNVTIFIVWMACMNHRAYFPNPKRDLSFAPNPAAPVFFAAALCVPSSVKGAGSAAAAP